VTAERTVAVNLRARVDQYLTGMRAAEAETRKFANTGKDAREVLQKQHEAFTKVGVGMAAVGATAAAGLGLVLKASTEFGSKMAQLQSLSHATSAEMKQLGDAAMTAGQSYGFTASQVADAEIELTKAGIGVKDQLGGALKGALELAAAGQIDVGQATEIATVAMTQFGLKAGEVPHVADLLAAGADKALGSVGDLGEGLKNGGLQAHNMGLTINDTVGLLSAFANAGILGAEAGTQMRSMFIQLQKPSAQAQEVLSKYGITLNDTSGKFVGITKLGEELRQKLGGLTQAQRNQALATIFGSHAISGATVLYNDSGKAAEKAGTSIADWIKNVNDSGFASAQAAGKMNSLQGDVQKLSAAFQTDLIKAGTSADGPFRSIVQSATNVVKAIGDIPAPLQAVGVGVTVVVAGVGLLGGAFLIAVPKIAEFRLALDKLHISGGKAAGMFGKGTALVLGITAFATGLAAAGVHAVAGTEDMARAADTITGKFKNLNAQFKGDFFTGITSARDALHASFGDGVNDAGIAKWVDSNTIGITHFADAWKKNEQTFNAYGQQLAALASKGNYSAATTGFNQLVKSLGGGKEVLHELQSATSDYRDEIIKQLAANHIQITEQNILNAEQGKGAAGVKILAAAQAEAKAAAEKQAEGLANLRGEASGATVDLDKLASAIEGFGSAQLDARGAARKLEAAFDDAMSTIKKNGKTLSNFTAAGRANGDALDGIATAALGAASKYLTLHHNADGAAKVLAHGRAEFIKAATAATGSAKAANKLADQLGLIPKNISTAVGVTGAKGVGDKIVALSKGAKAFAKRYEAELRANAVPAANAHKRAMALAKQWDKEHATATLDANNRKALAAAKAANAQSTAFAQKAYLAQLLANNIPAKKAIAMAKGLAHDFDQLNPKPTLDAKNGPALAKIRAAQAAINALHGKTVGVSVVYHQIGRGKLANGAFAEGGQIDGPGPKGVDSVPIMAAPGEHMLTTKDVDRLGGQAGVYRFREALQAGAVGAYAAGGAIPHYTTAPRYLPTPAGGSTSPVEVVMPDTMQIIDADGTLMGRFRVVADQRIARHEHTNKLRVPR
jgi:TP901 family phage tail tape measure protein